MRCLPVKRNEPRSRDAARSLNVRFVGFFLQTDLATRLSRLGRRQGDASDATPEIAGLQEKYDIGAIDWTRRDASGTAYRPEITEQIYEILVARASRAFARVIRWWWTRYSPVNPNATPSAMPRAG